MKIGNMYVTASIACNAAVHPRYQEKGIFSSIVNGCYLDAAENDLPLTYGFANIRLGQTYKRYEWQGHICFMFPMIKVLNWKPILNRYAHSELLAGGAAYMIRRIRRSHQPSTDENVKIEKISRFDKRIDTFWEKISSHFEIIGKRDQKYLNWRYLDNPWNAYSVYLATTEKKVLGYYVLRIAQEGDVKTGIIADIRQRFQSCRSTGQRAD